MQGFELAAISVPPSDFHNFFEVATGHRRNAGNRACDSLRGALCFSTFCEKHPRMLVGVFSVLCEVISGHRRNAGIRACGYFGAPIGFS